MAKKTVLVCDSCGAEVEETRGAAMRVTYADAPAWLQGRRPVRQLCRQASGPRRSAAWAPAEVGDRLRPSSRR